MNIQEINIQDLKPAVYNPRKALKKGDKEYKRIETSIKEFGYIDPIIINKDNTVIGGHQRLTVLKDLGYEIVKCVVVDVDKNKEKALNLALNKISGDWDDVKLKELLFELKTEDFNIELTGFDDFVIPDLPEQIYIAEPQRKDIQQPTTNQEIQLNNNQSSETNNDEETEEPQQYNKLSDIFIAPPFSVLDSRQGYWLERKRYWLNTGIESNLGRTAECLPSGEVMKKYKRFQNFSGTSIFDPVLAEIVYKWFCLPKGNILDPFAGGSVRGVVAAGCGYNYTGIDIRSEQIAENQKQLIDISKNFELTGNCHWFCGVSKDITNVLNANNQEITSPEELTPILKIDDIFVKRDDLFTVAGVNGGKARSCFEIMKNEKNGVTTAGSRKSPQINIVSAIANFLKIKCFAHCPSGELGEDLKSAELNGATIIQHKGGYNNVIKSRAKKQAEADNLLEVPFGMECKEAIIQTGKQVLNIPADVKRIVVPVGSGMSLSGILTGLKENNINIPVLGVVVGADPKPQLNKFAPQNWSDMVELVASGVDYHTEITGKIGDILLDPIYEAKCLKFLKPGDLLWIVGARESIVKQNKKIPFGNQFDLLFTCPPYSDLEVYSDLPGDISNMDYKSFISVYNEIIKNTVKHLKENRFAVFVVGEIRDKNGIYRNFIKNTIEAFTGAGLHFYNEIIMVMPVGTLAIRSGRQFNSGRKIGKLHQNILVFYKGNPELIKEVFPKIALPEEIENENEEMNETELEEFDNFESEE